MEYTKTEIEDAYDRYGIEIEDAYDKYGITVKNGFAATASESTKSYHVSVRGWNYERRIIERDGLISFQVTVHGPSCQGCYGRRVFFVQALLAVKKVQCFWTREPDDGSLYVTVGPAPPHMTTQMYLAELGLFVSPHSTDLQGSDNVPKQVHSKKRRTKACRPKRRHTVQ
jgi:hypothetical protein